MIEETFFFEIARIAKAKKPTYLLLENVKGLLGHDGGRTFAIILETLDELGYDVQWQVLNSKHFGVPQNRERVFIVANIREKSPIKVFPILESDKVSYRSRGVEEGIRQDLQEIKFYDTTKRIANIKEGGQGNRIYSITGMSVTLSANGGGRGAKTGLYMCYDEGINDYVIRKLTPLECFRLHGFPDSIYHTARRLKLSDSQLYKMAGNSVTVPVVQTVGLKLYNEIMKR